MVPEAAGPLVAVGVNAPYVYYFEHAVASEASSFGGVDSRMYGDTGASRGVRARLVSLPPEPDGGCDYLDSSHPRSE